MRFTDERQEVGVLETLVQLTPAFGVAFVLCSLAAGAYVLADLEGLCMEPVFDPTLLRLGLAGVGAVSGLLAVVLWRRPFSRALWWPTLLIPVALLWDLGIEDPQLRGLQAQIRLYALDPIWRSSIGALPLIGSFLLAARIVGRRLSFGPVDAVGLCAAIGLSRLAYIVGLQLLLPAIVVVAVLAFVPTAAFFERDRAVLPEAVKALARAPAGSLVSVLTYGSAGLGSLGLYAAISYVQIGDATRGLLQHPQEPLELFVVELVYVATLTAGGLVLFALWHARVSPPEATEQPANPVGE
jgi:hypothetical protein